MSRTDLYLIDLAACFERRGVGTPITLTPNADKRKVIENCAVQIREVADILFADSAQLDSKPSISHPTPALPCLWGLYSLGGQGGARVVVALDEATRLAGR